MYRFSTLSLLIAEWTELFFYMTCLPLFCGANQFFSWQRIEGSSNLSSMSFSYTPSGAKTEMLSIFVELIFWCWWSNFHQGIVLNCAVFAIFFTVVIFMMIIENPFIIIIIIIIVMIISLQALQVVGRYTSKPVKHNPIPPLMANLVNFRKKN